MMIGLKNGSRTSDLDHFPMISFEIVENFIFMQKWKIVERKTRWKMSFIDRLFELNLIWISLK